MIFPKPITFPVFKDGEFITATVIEEIDHSVVTMFRVRFSDGFEEMFGIEHISGQVVAMEVKGGPYAKAIRYDLPVLIDLDSTLFWHVFQQEMKGEMVNVWVMETQHDGDTIYLVYYKAEFKFPLKRKNAQWVFPETPNEINEADKALAARTGFMLDSLL